MSDVIHIDQPCAGGCGRRVVRDLEDPGSGTFASRLRALAEEEASGQRPVWCDDCVEQDLTEEADWADKALRRRVDRGGVPASFRELTWSDVDKDPDRAGGIVTAQAWAAGTLSQRGVYFYGEVGRGKSMIAAVAAQEVARRRRIRWLNVAKLLTDLRQSFSSPAYARAASALDPAGPLEVLILDDLDKARAREQDAQVLYVAVNAWLEEEAPLFVTANHSLDRLAEKLGETFGAPIASRLAGYCLDVEIGGRDRRLEP